MRINSARRWVALSTLMLASVSAVLAESTPPTTQSSEARLPANVECSFAKTDGAIVHPERVIAWRVKPSANADRSRGIVGFPIVGGSSKLSAQAAQELGRLVLDPRAHLQGDGWCGPIRPCAAFQFFRERHVLTVLVCFKCARWEFWLVGQRLGLDICEGVQPELLKLVTATFPNDADLRAIVPGDVFAKIYRIGELSASPSPATVKRAIGEWSTKIEATVGEQDQWSNAGGTRYTLWPTPDGMHLIVITSEHGHAAITKLKGLSVESPRQ